MMRGNGGSNPNAIFFFGFQPMEKSQRQYFVPVAPDAAGAELLLKTCCGFSHVVQATSPKCPMPQTRDADRQVHTGAQLCDTSKRKSHRFRMCQQRFTRLPCR